MNKIKKAPDSIIFLLFLLLLSACSQVMEEHSNFYTQQQVKPAGSVTFKDIILFTEGSYLLNVEPLKPLFGNKTITCVEIYATDATKPVRKIDVKKNITHKIQLFPGNASIIVSDGVSEFGFMTNVRESGTFIKIDKFSTLAADFFKDIVLKLTDPGTPGPAALINPEKLYSQIKEIGSFSNIDYAKYLDYIMAKGLPYDLLSFFYIQLSAPVCSYLLELEWNKANTDGFSRYEIYRYNSADFSNSILVAVINDINQNQYKEILWDNLSYYYYVKIIDQTGELTTNPVSLARYPSGMVIRLFKNEALAEWYREHNDLYRTQEEYFIKVNLNGADDGGIDLSTRICGKLCVADFIRNEGGDIYAWSANDPARGFLSLSLPVMKVLDNISRSVAEQSGVDITVRKGYISPFNTENYDEPHIFGDGFDIRTETEEQWMHIAELAEKDDVSFIDPLYKTFTTREPGEQYIHIDWRCFPEFRHSDFTYNPGHFHDHYSIETVSSPRAGKILQIKNGDSIIEQVDFNKYDIKVSRNSPVNYFRISAHFPDKAAVYYDMGEQFHKYRCAHCGNIITENHQWRIINKVDPEAPPPQPDSAGKNKFTLFNESSHWENECILCGYRKGVESHELDSAAGFSKDLDTHWQSCKSCLVKLSKAYHVYNQWEPVADSRVHMRKCAACNEIQVRPHSRVTNWNPVFNAPHLGHSKYCSECWVIVEPVGKNTCLPHEPAAEFSFNGEKHWQYCNICRFHCNEANHTLGPYVDLNNGEHRRSCTQCDFTVIGAHSFTDDWIPFPGNKNAGHIRYCEQCGGKDPRTKDCYAHTPGTEWFSDGSVHWKICSACGYRSGQGNHITGDWQHDDDYHWKNCIICNQKIQHTPHKFENWVVDYTRNIHRAVCDECSYEIDEDHTWSDFIPYPRYAASGHVRYCTKCNIPYSESGDHNYTVFPHNNGTGYKYDEKEHWYCCDECGYIHNRKAHVFGDWIETTEGSEERTCRDCGFTEVR